MAKPLIERWTDLTDRFGLTGSLAVGEDLLRRYAEPHRRYHTQDHLGQVLDALEANGADARLQLAAWFHDAVYRPGRPDNEARSAALGRNALQQLGLGAGDIEVVAAAVLATADHLAGEARFAALIDADLAILAAPPARYQAYAEAVRAEHGHIPGWLYRRGRARFLRGLLTAPRLFSTPEGQRGEAQARDNVRQELSRLTQGT